MNIKERLMVALFLIVASGWSLYFHHVDLKRGYISTNHNTFTRANDPELFDRVSNIQLCASVIAACLAMWLIISAVRMFIKRVK